MNFLKPDSCTGSYRKSAISTDLSQFYLLEQNKILCIYYSFAFKGFLSRPIWALPIRYILISYLHSFIFFIHSFMHSMSIHQIPWVRLSSEDKEEHGVSNHLDLTLSLILSPTVWLRKLFNFSNSQFPYLRNGHIVSPTSQGGCDN